MSDLKITALGFEALVLSTETPSPIPLPEELGIPINPMVFRPNWSSEIRLRTRWLTDVTRPDQSNRTERWSLLSRPSRTLSVSLTGMGKEESEAMLQAARQHTQQHGVPVPIYPDAVAVREASGSTIWGNFSRRRFFREGRVVVYPADPAPVRSSGAVFYATLAAVHPDRIELSGALPRDVGPADTVAPCMDVEISNEIRGTALTDSIWESSMSWTEVEGACSLPALWPSVTSGDSSILSPFCTVLDGLAVFPFEPHWGQGVGVDIVREMESSPSGRGVVKTPNGSPAHRFSVTLMGYDRERVWNIARFFDAVRGRAHSFYMVHPMRPWKPFGPMVSPGSLTLVRILPTGDRYAVQDGVRKIVLFRADGSAVTRDVQQVADIGTHFSVLVTPALPDENFVDAQPIYVGTFDQDEIEEVWSTNEVVPAISLAFVENPSPGDVEAGNQEFFQFPLSNHAFQSVPGLNLLLRAGSGCYSPSGALCSAWPGNSTVARWVDESEGPARDSRQRGVLKQMVPLFSNPPPALIRFPSTFDNNKQTSIKAGGFSLSHQIDPATPPLQRSLWSTGGWTLFLCMSPMTDFLTPQDDRDLVRIQEAGGICFRFLSDTNPARGIASRSMVEILDGLGIVQAINLDALNYRNSTGPVVFCVRVDTSVRVWINGVPATSSAFPLPNGMWGPVSYVTSNWFPGVASNAAPSSASIRAAWEHEGCHNLVASYNRALTLNETNLINSTISNIFRAGAGTISFY